MATSLDDIKRQKQLKLTNEMLLSDVDAQEERLQRQHRKAGETALAQQIDFQEWHKEANAALDLQQDGTRWVQLPPLSVSDLVEKMELDVSFTEVEELSTRYGDAKDSDHAFYQHLRRMIKNDEEGKAHSAHEAINHLKTIQDAKNDNAHLVRCAVSAHEFSKKRPVETDTVLRILAAREPNLKALRKQLDSIEVSRDQALHEREDMATAEALHNQMDDVLEEIVHEHLARLSLLLDSAHQEKFVEDVAGLANSTKTEVELHRTDRDDLIGKLTADLDRLDSALKQAEQDHDESEDDLRKLQAKCKMTLLENARAQNDVYDEIGKLYTSLSALGEERKGLVDDLIHEKSAHEGKAAEITKLQQTARGHRETLKWLLGRVEDSGGVLDLVEAFTNKTKEFVVEASSQAKRETGDVLLNERRSHFAAYKQYYHTLGDLLFAKELRHQNIVDQADSIQQSLAMTKNTLDPKKAEYQHALRELEILRQSIEVDIDSLRLKADEATEDAVCTEEALLEAGDHVVSPAIELQEKNAERTEQLTVRRRQRLDQQRRAVDAQEQDTAGRKRLAKQARITGLSASMAPLSPAYKPKEGPEVRRRNYAERLRRAVTSPA